MRELRYPDDNPKTLNGVRKVPYHLVPPSAVIYLAMALKDGAAKYTPYNWRKTAITASTYISACKRHIDAWWDGEEVAQDSGVHHLAHAMTCLALLLDAESIGKLNDDRPTPGAAAELLERFTEPTEPEDDGQLELEFGEPDKSVRDEYTEALGRSLGEMWDRHFVESLQREEIKQRAEEAKREAILGVSQRCPKISEFVKPGARCKRLEGHEGFHAF